MKTIIFSFFFFILIFSLTISYSQSTTVSSSSFPDSSITSNFRKEFSLYLSIRTPHDSRYSLDYLFTQYGIFTYKKANLFYLLSSVRQNGQHFIINNEKFDYIFVSIQNYENALKNINFASLDFYKSYKFVKLGLSDIYQDDHHKIFLYNSVKYKIITFDIYYLKKVSKVIFTVNKNFIIKNGFSSGIKFNYIHSDDKDYMQSVVTFNYIM